MAETVGRIPRSSACHRESDPKIRYSQHSRRRANEPGLIVTIQMVAANWV